MMLRRARIALGTLVEMRVEGLRDAAALRALETAFAEVAAIHRLMSFHAADSDLSRLHATPAGQAVRIDARTCAVLESAQHISGVSHGLFDITVAAQLVRADMLPRPRSPFEPGESGDWRDIELLGDSHVRLRQPLWLDLGGIAKGYAVDRAIEVLREHGATHAVVNAGGDLRVHGTRAETVVVRMASGAAGALLELADGAVASSVAGTRDAGARSPHVHGATRAVVRSGTAVSVVAPRCIHADALTKVVLAGDAQISAAALRACAAHAVLHDETRRSRWLGLAA